jgi:Ras GTPase-activating-like protein IQGAP2/3
MNRLLNHIQLCIQEEITSANSIADIAHGHPMYINIAIHYIRPNQMTYARDALQAIICEVINSDDLDLEVDPSLVFVVHKLWCNVFSFFL